MKKLLFLPFVFLFFQSVAQQDFYIGGQFDAGIAGKTTFENNTLDKKNYSPHLGGLLSLNWRLFDVIGIEVGMGQHWNNSRFKDPSFESENEGFSVSLKNKNYYWNYYAALSGFAKLGRSDNYLYGKLGYSINVYGDETVSNSKTFQISRLDIDETLSSTTSYSSTNQSLMPEIGLQRKLSYRNLISVGLKMNLGLDQALSGEYVIRNNIDNSREVDQFSSLGNFTSLVVSYNLLLHHIPKKEKVKRIPLKVKEPRYDKPSKPVERKTPTAIANRKLVVRNKLKVHSSTVTVFIWDDQTVDGDRVSLNFNDEWILEDYTLKKEKYSFQLELDEGMNTFVLHALNLGKYEPNTAALIIQEGEKTHKILLESNFSRSGTLEINYKKHD